MCLASAYIKEDENKDLVLENITTLERTEKGFLLTNIFKESQKIEAVIKNIDFEKGMILLEKEN